MYKIKSIQGGKVIIGDLNLHLVEGQEIDLDNLFPRDRIDASVHLRCAIEKRLVAVVHKDVYLGGIDHSALAGLEARLRQQIQQQMTPQSPAVPQQNMDMDVLLKKLSEMIGSTNPQNVKPEVDETQSELDADKQVDIHARAVQRLRRNAEGHVESKQETKNSDVASRADELEGLL